MGGWSSALSPPFIAFAGTPDGAEVLDVGCGTGSLLAALSQLLPAARLSGIDPSPSLLGKARLRIDLPGVALVAGTAEHIPFADRSFDHTLSMLVLQEFPDPAAALREMRRVTRPGGWVAGCQWDFERMPIIAANMAGISRVAPEVGHAILTGFPHLFGSEDELVEAWMASGFTDVVAARITVTRNFATWDDIWRPLLEGTTPSTLALASLPRVKQHAVRELIRERLGPRPDGSFSVTAEAMAVRGRA
jgi:SAM-dependent methyltransferase